MVMELGGDDDVLSEELGDALDSLIFLCGEDKCIDGPGGGEGRERRTMRRGANTFSLF